MSVKDRKSLKKRILEEEDFIYCPRLGNSLSRLIDGNDNGVDDVRIGKVLLMDDEEVKTHYESAVRKLKEKMGVTE